MDSQERSTTFLAHCAALVAEAAVAAAVDAIMSLLSPASVGIVLEHEKWLELRMDSVKEADLSFVPQPPVPPICERKKKESSND